MSITLYTKLAEVVAEVGYVKKDGTNDFQNYKYTSAEALLAAIRGPLSSRNVVLMPSLLSVEEREYTTSKGKASIITTAHVRFTFVDGDTGEARDCEWAGQGDDPADKGLGKAYTNAIKTFVRETFLIPQGDDPEADPRTDERGADRAPSRSRQAPRPQAAPVQQTEKPANASQKGLINARASEAGLSAEQLAAAILKASGSDAREFETAEQAMSFVHRSMDRLPARLVDGVLAQIGEAA